MGNDGEKLAASADESPRARLHYTAPPVTLAEIVLETVRKLPGPPDVYFCQRVGERAEECGLPRPRFEDVHAALDTLVLVGRIEERRRNQDDHPTRQSTAGPPAPPDGVEVWRGEAQLTGIAGVTTIAVTRRQLGSYVPWAWVDGEWVEPPTERLTREVLAAWALSAEARAGNALSRATLVEVQLDEAKGIAERRGTEVAVVRELAGRAHHVLHVADVTLFAMRDVPLADSLVTKLDGAVRAVGEAHGALHKAGIAAVEPDQGPTLPLLAQAADTMAAAEKRFTAFDEEIERRMRAIRGIGPGGPR